MDTKGLSLFQKIVFITIMLALIVYSVVLVRNLASENKAPAQKRKMVEQPESTDSSTKRVDVMVYGKVFDKEGLPIKNQILVAYGFDSFVNGEDLIFFKIIAISDSAKNDLRKTDIVLPDLVYSSIEQLSEKIIAIRKAKTKKELDENVVIYKESLNESNNLVSLNGFQIIEDHYFFQSGKKINTFD